MIKRARCGVCWWTWFCVLLRLSFISVYHAHIALHLCSYILIPDYVNLGNFFASKFRTVISTSNLTTNLYFFSRRRSYFLNVFWSLGKSYLGLLNSDQFLSDPTSRLDLNPIKLPFVVYTIIAKCFFHIRTVRVANVVVTLNEWLNLLLSKYKNVF